MQTRNPFFDDIARVAGGAMGALSGLKAEVETLVRQQMERWLSSMDLVTRDEFEAVRAMAAKARERQEDLERRLAELEARPAARARKTAAHPDAGEGDEAAEGDAPPGE
jgi:BMFP domain-containing protein YqiC